MPGNTLARRLLAGLTAGFLVVLGGVAPASPAAAADLPGGAYLFAGEESQLEVINRVTGTAFASIPLSTAPADVVTGVANGTVYAAVANTVVAVDATTLAVTRTITSSTAFASYVSLAVSPDGSRLYALDQQNNLVDVYDPLSGQPISSIPVLAQVPWDIDMSPDGSTIYVIYSEVATVSVISTASPPGVVGTFSIPSTSENAVFSPDGGTAYIYMDGPSGTSENNVAVVDTKTRTVRTVWATGNGAFPIGIAVSPDGSRVYLAAQVGVTAGRMVTVDATTGSPAPPVPLPDVPQYSSPRLTADGLDLYIALKGNKIVGVNTNTGVTRTYTTAGPVEVAALVDMTSPVFESSAAATFVAGVPHTSGVVTQAFPRAALSVDGTLPTGVTFTDNGDGTGTFAGTATKPGTYPVTISAVNSVGRQTQPYTITVVPGVPAALLATAGRARSPPQEGSSRPSSRPPCATVSATPSPAVR